MDLHYEVNGSGDPVVLLHSGGTHLRDWTLVAPLLSEKYKVIAFDGRGTGKSPSPSGQVNYVDDLKEVLDFFEIDQAVLVGHSIGGQIATDFTLEYPGRVSKLILIAPALSGFHYSEKFQSYIKSINKAAPDIDRMIELSLNAPSYRIVTAGPQQGLLVKMLRHYLERVLAWPAFEMIWPQPPADQRLEELAAKTLFLIGKEELPDNHRVADRFRQVQSARVVEMPGADHMVTLTHPEELTELMTAFMEDEIHDAANPAGK